VGIMLMQLYDKARASKHINVFCVRYLNCELHINLMLQDLSRAWLLVCEGCVMDWDQLCLVSSSIYSTLI
jgi:hypothetical protein